ncbi:unnamed protein product [Zymoseptoria tritici ST99CH_3D1]|nr:unnamed protein product [Zymoseptoria tritici ST99CH_3D1]
MLAPTRYRASFLLLAFPFIFFILFYTHRESLLSVQELLHTKPSPNEPPAAHYDSAFIHESKLEGTRPEHSSLPVVNPVPILFDESRAPPPIYTAPVAPSASDSSPDPHTQPSNSLPHTTLSPSTPSPSPAFDSTSPPCLALSPLAQDTVIILKTGSTEIASKFPIHTTTTLRCYPHSLIFSDHAENFHNATILDALASVSPAIQATHPDFHLWRRLKQNGREALDGSELAGPGGMADPNGTGHASNPGWKLDKWKFLPMLAATYTLHPSKKWYIFLETDTYLFFQSALAHLSSLPSPSTEKFYIGADTLIGDTHFTHGGSGFAISHAAMSAVVEMYRSEQAHWELVTDNHWAGDAVLGLAMAKAGVSVMGAAPTWQGRGIGDVEFGEEEGKGRWCAPTVSFHHLSADEVREMWEFEQKWILSTKGDMGRGMRWRDVYQEYVLPRVSDRRQGWENTSPSSPGSQETTGIQDLAACARLCEQDGSCVQYTFIPTEGRPIEGRCVTSTSPRLGSAKEGSQAGWMKSRMEAFAGSMPRCEGGILWPGTQKWREALMR